MASNKINTSDSLSSIFYNHYEWIERRRRGRRRKGDGESNMRDKRNSSSMGEEHNSNTEILKRHKCGNELDAGKEEKS